MDASLHGADLEIPPLMFDVLTWTRDLGCGQCLWVVRLGRSPPKE